MSCKAYWSTSLPCNFPIYLFQQQHHFTFLNHQIVQIIKEVLSNNNNIFTHICGTSPSEAFLDRGKSKEGLSSHRLFLFCWSFCCFSLQTLSFCYSTTSFSLFYHYYERHWVLSMYISLLQESTQHVKWFLPSRSFSVHFLNARVRLVGILNHTGTQLANYEAFQLCLSFSLPSTYPPSNTISPSFSSRHLFGQL